jgi:hypothetical protein
VRISASLNRTRLAKVLKIDHPPSICLYGGTGDPRFSGCLLGRDSPRLAENRPSTVDLYVRGTGEPRFSGCLLGRDSPRLAENRAVAVRFCTWRAPRVGSMPELDRVDPRSVELRERAPVEHGVIANGLSRHDDVVDDGDPDRFRSAHDRRRGRNVLLAR